MSEKRGIPIVVEVNEDVINIPEGGQVRIQYPDGLTTAAINEIEAWLNLLVQRMRRQSILVNADTSHLNNRFDQAVMAGQPFRIIPEVKGQSPEPRPMTELEKKL